MPDGSELPALSQQEQDVPPEEQEESKSKMSRSNRGFDMKRLPERMQTMKNVLEDANQLEGNDAGADRISLPDQ